MDYTNAARPSMPITIAASAARTSSTDNTGNLKDTTANLPVSDRYDIYLDVTAFTAGSSPVFRATLQTSPDGGTTWLVAHRFTTVSTSTATQRLGVRNGKTLGEAGTQASTTSGDLNQNTQLTRDVRLAWTISGGNGETATVTFAAYALVEP